MATLQTHATDELLREFVRQARAPRIRTMLQFAEQEIVIPDGPFKGRRFRGDRQPWSALWFAEIDAGHHRKYVATGPSQSGKTLTCYVIPALYHLFEANETFIAGVPSMVMAADKWKQDLLPAIAATRYKELLPTSGDGSRGGDVESVIFKNGATLRFMAGGGGDKQRAGFTGRVLGITETDGMDESGADSHEADKISQLEARTRAFGGRARTYMECTVTVKDGRTWREYTQGTGSRIVLLCPHCGGWVSPEREHLVGWKDAETVLDARDRAAFACPACAKLWTDGDRETANRHAKLVHVGQQISADGTITGDPPRTATLGFRWSAVNNLFVRAADLAEDEWNAARDPNPDNAERKMRQFVWCMPYEPPDTDLSQLEVSVLTKRVLELGRGILPKTTGALTVGVDLGKWLCRWVLVAWSDVGSPHVVDYNVTEVPTAALGEERGLEVALNEIRSMCEAGWKVAGTDETRQPDQVWFDTGWHGEHGNLVYRLCGEWGDRYRPAKGYGVGQEKYLHPRALSKSVRVIGDGYHASRQPGGLWLMHINADKWKSFWHERAKTPTASPGGMTLFKAEPQEHLSYAKHLTAEQKVEEFQPGKGVVIRWHCKSRNNHYFDASMIAAAAAHFAGVRLSGKQDTASRAPETLETKWFASRRKL